MGIVVVTRYKIKSARMLAKSLIFSELRRKRNPLIIYNSILMTEQCIVCRKRHSIREGAKSFILLSENRVLACHVLSPDNVHATNRAELLLHARRKGSSN